MALNRGIVDGANFTLQPDAVANIGPHASHGWKLPWGVGGTTKSGLAATVTAASSPTSFHTDSAIDPFVTGPLVGITGANAGEVGIVSANSPSGGGERILTVSGLPNTPGVGDMFVLLTGAGPTPITPGGNFHLACPNQELPVGGDNGYKIDIALAGTIGGGKTLAIDLVIAGQI
jgi:hypothetical protein